jgi:hypothetical protein
VLTLLSLVVLALVWRVAALVPRMPRRAARMALALPLTLPPTLPLTLPLTLLPPCATARPAPATALAPAMTIAWVCVACIAWTACLPTARGGGW